MLIENRYYIQITLDGRTISVLTSQIWIYSTKRILCKIEELDISDCQKVFKEVLKIFKLSPSIIRGSRG